MLVPIPHGKRYGEAHGRLCNEPHGKWMLLRHMANGAAKRMTSCVTNRTTSDTVNGIKPHGKPHGEAHSKRYGELCDEPTRKF